VVATALATSDVASVVAVNTSAAAARRKVDERSRLVITVNECSMNSHGLSPLEKSDYVAEN
jgi:hypothetical protein